MQYDWERVLLLMKVIERRSLHPKASALFDAAQAELDQILAGEPAEEE